MNVEKETIFLCFIFLHSFSCPLKYVKYSVIPVDLLKIFSLLSLKVCFNIYLDFENFKSEGNFPHTKNLQPHCTVSLPTEKCRLMTVSRHHNDTVDACSGGICLNTTSWYKYWHLTTKLHKIHELYRHIHFTKSNCMDTYTSQYPTVWTYTHYNIQLYGHIHITKSNFTDTDRSQNPTVWTHTLHNIQPYGHIHITISNCTDIYTSQYPTLQTDTDTSQNPTVWTHTHHNIQLY